MELHEFFQWTLNFFFIGVAAFFWNDRRKPKLQAQSRLPSLHDEKAKTLIHTLEKLEAEAALKLKSASDQWDTQIATCKRQLIEETRQLKQNWQLEMQNILQDCVKDIEQMKKQWHADRIDSRVHFEQTMNRLKTLCNEAQRLIQNAKALEFSENPSHEEKEIKEALASLDENPIPTVRELEDARLRLKRESTLDLKSVLNEQLS